MIAALVAAASLIVAPPIVVAPEAAPDTDAASEPEPQPTPESDPEPEPAPAPAPESEPASKPESAPPPDPVPVHGPDKAAAAAAASGGIGGYHDAFALRGRPPKDGEDEILAGSIVMPLGVIGVASAGAQLWLSMPGHCQERWGSLGSTPSANQCDGIYAFSIFRVVHSGLMAVTGGVLLGIGLYRRKRLKEWKRGVTWPSRVSGSPWVTRTGAGLGIAIRFGTPG